MKIKNGDVVKVKQSDELFYVQDVDHEKKTFHEAIENNFLAVWNFSDVEHVYSKVV